MKTRRRIRGFNLPELMVSLTIGLLLLAAFVVLLDPDGKVIASQTTCVGEKP